MPFDAVVTRSVVNELNELLVGGRVDKTYQPFCDEIILNIRSKGYNHKLLVTVNPSCPRIHLTNMQKENPINAPMFSMLLRKHLTGGRVLSITCDDFERIVMIEVESRTELGDLLKKRLVIEIMGKYSNIILVNHENKIIDSIKHVDNEMSAVREIMPAREYIMPPVQDKISPFDVSVDELFYKADVELGECILSTIKGFSPYIIKNICKRASVSYNDVIGDLSQQDIAKVKEELTMVIDKIRRNEFIGCIVHGEKDDFYCIDFGEKNVEIMPSVNECIDKFYQDKSILSAINSEKANLLRVVNTNISRCNKKMNLQENKIREAKRDYDSKIYGDLLVSNLYRIPGDADFVVLENFFSPDMEKIRIPLDPKISPNDNAQRYFKRYRKAKNTIKMQKEELDKTKDELEYLEGVLHSIENCSNMNDLEEVKEELQEEGYQTSKYSKYSKKVVNRVSCPRKFVTKDGFIIMVGKNNKQNDELTLRWASPHDMWLHIRGGQGSHVVIRTDKKEVPMDVIYKAACLGAYYSKEREARVVEVDYTFVKNVRKSKNGKPGKVIYYNSKTISVTPGIDETLTFDIKK